MTRLKILRAAIRKLSDLSIELLHSGDSELMAEVQEITARLLTIQDRLAKKEEK